MSPPSMPRVSQVLAVSEPMVPWLVRAMPTTPPYGVPPSATRWAYTVISTLRQLRWSAGSWTYILGTGPET